MFQKIGNFVRTCGSQLVAAVAVAAPLALVGVPAHAALPTELTAAFTTLTADSTALIAMGWPVFALIVGGLVLFKLAKKVIGKAT